MPNDGPGQFGGMLQRLRAAGGLSQEELAERAGLSQRGISDLERGKRRAPHPATVRRLAEALGLAEAERAALLGASRTPGSNAGASVPVHADDGAQHNLPLQLTSFIGRVQETGDVRRELARTRLLTLTGPGGVGKTRLALHVAEQELATYRDGVWLVELAPLQDAELVAQLVASVFNVRQNPQEPLITTMTRRFQSLHLLLILDNCEHVLKGCVDLIHRFLRSCPHIEVLATSREVLGLAAETIWRVPPMGVGAADVRNALEQVAQSEAAALFVERARAVQPSFAVTPRNAASLLEVCRCLEGIPLAIELAARRVNVLALEQMAERLARHFGILSSNDPTVATRQQTLEKTIQWSYDLLTPTEQVLFDRLSVFAGGWSLEAMEAVAGSDIPDGDSLLDLLARLIDKSLVVADTDTQARYHFLEPLRQFGQKRLQERHEFDATHERHAAFFLDQFEKVWEAFIKTGSAAPWLSPDLDNVRTALRWLMVKRHADRAQRLAAASGVTWLALGDPAEGRRWLEEALALDPVSGSPSVRANVLRSITMIALQQGDLDGAEDAASRNLELDRRLADAGAAVWPLTYLGRIAQLRGDFARARLFFQGALDASRETRQSGHLLAEVFDVGAQSYFAQVALEQGDPAEAAVLAEQALKLAKAARHPPYICLASMALGDAFYQHGRLENAHSVWEEGLARVREVTHRHHYAIRILINLGRLLQEQGDRRGAGPLIADGLMLAEEMSRWQLAHGFEVVAEIAGEENELESALQLGGAAAALRAALRTPIWPTERARLDPVLSRARESLGSRAADAAWTRGWAAPVDQGLDLALD